MRKPRKQPKLLLLISALTFGLGAAGVQAASSVGEEARSTHAAAAAVERSAPQAAADAASAVPTAEAESALSESNAGAAVPESESDSTATADSTADAAVTTENGIDAQASSAAAAEASRDADGTSSVAADASTDASVAVETEDGATAKTKSSSKSITTKFGAMTIARTTTHVVLDDGTRVKARARAKAMALATPGVTKADSKTSADVTIHSSDFETMAGLESESTTPDSSPDTAGISEANAQ